MDLILFVIFLLLSFLLIILGLIKTEHSELALIGFVFLFLLSLVLIVNDIQIKTGYNTDETYIYGINLTDYHYDDYDVDPSFWKDITNAEDALLFHSNQTLRYTYDDINLGGNLSHIFGYWLAVISSIGFLGVLIGLKPKEAF